jgi:hypothetical protein
MQLKNVIAHDLNEIDIWSKKWLMSFNPDKTEIMIFSNRSVPEKSGLMYTRYSLSKLVRLRRYFKLRRMFKCLDTLLLILSTWLFHLASLLNVTPKCL